MAGDVLLSLSFLFIAHWHASVITAAAAACPCSFPRLSPRVCACVCLWGSRAEALMRSIVIQGTFTQATPAGSPGTSPLKRRTPSSRCPPPLLLLYPFPFCSLISLSRQKLQSWLRGKERENRGQQSSNKANSHPTQKMKTDVYRQCHFWVSHSKIRFA